MTKQGYRRVVNAVRHHAVRCAAHISDAEHVRLNNIAVEGDVIAGFIERRAALGCDKLAGAQAALRLDESEVESLVVFFLSGYGFTAKQLHHSLYSPIPEGIL